MDFIFLLEEGERIAFLHQLMQSLGCAYICLWSYLPQPCNYFVCLDGLFIGDNNVARRLFEEYRHSLPIANDGRVPGFAFRNNLQHLELRFEELQILASNPVQLQFYREAGIKTAILMGCRAGEVEVGMSTNPQVNMEMEMMRVLSQEPASKPTTSSSTSLRSLSMESPTATEYTSLLFNVPIPSTSYNAPSDDLPSISGHVTQAAAAGVDPALSLIGTDNQFPFLSMRQTEEDDAMARAYLAVISSTSSSSQARDSFASNFQNPSAFRIYRRRSSSLSSENLSRNNVPAAVPPPIIRRRQGNMFRKCVAFFRNLDLLRRRGLIQGGGTSAAPPSTTQVHHVISERRRREKLNESFQQLRSLIPPGSKKDKASVLSNTTEYLASLKAQVEELTKKNQILEAQLPPPPPQKAPAAVKEEVGASSAAAAEGRVDVSITNVEESTSEEANRRFVDLRVLVRGEISMSDLVIRLLEFLKGVENVGLISVQANTTTVQSASLNRIILRLTIHEGDEWDESAFQEAVKRVVGDVAQ
ncbi:PREDICTED: putative transcription factor bHLH041 [Ipomoea nil]|uniref:putative transcription factor bHLH041 n=1 Tax=Ipomoea nil TaxID=35883 RepID=UPI000901661E|nr:PREDICTED: putative transcription factor bHLH041 [Ipomoea nil]